jgi:hypothetical protein
MGSERPYAFLLSVLRMHGPQHQLLGHFSGLQQAALRHELESRTRTACSLPTTKVPCCDINLLPAKHTPGPVLVISVGLGG